MAIKTRKASDLNQKKLNAIIMGESGTGKTYLARTIPSSMKVLFINISPYEDGTISISDLDIDVVDITSVEEMNNLMEDLKTDTKYDVIYLDGLTALSKLSMEYASNANPGVAGKFKKYEDHSRFMEVVLLTLKAIDKYVFSTCLAAYEEEAGAYKFALDGKAFGKILGARVDAILPIKVNKEGKRALLTQNDGTYPAKVRLPGDKQIAKLIAADLGKLLEVIGYVKTKEEKK